MRKRIIGVLMFVLILISMLSMAFIIKPSFAENGENNILGKDFMEKSSETTSPNKAIKPNQANGLDSSWRNIFENKPDTKQDKTLESSGQTSRDDEDKWNFNDTSEWSNFAYADGNKTRLIVGVDGENLNSLVELEEIAARHQAKIVNTVSIGGHVRAAVVELLLVSVTAFVGEIHVAGVASYIEPNMKVQVQFVPNDPYWSLQWGPQKIEADWAWNTTVGSHSVLVAVVDTGIDYTHPDLAANYVPLGYDWVNMDPDPLDDFGHGTHCAGIIAAVLNNNIGIAGLAQVRVMAEKVLNSGGGGYWDWVANGIINATDCGANIISMSLGGYGESELLHDAVKYAYTAGVLLVAAAGNDNTNMKSYPAGYDEVIAVAATDQSDSKAYFSNWGDWIELAAPGVSIYSTMPTYHVTLNDWGYSMYYEYLSGTSMACPHVAGVAALLWSLYPNRSRDWIRLWLRYTAEDLGDPGVDVYYGYGRINVRHAIAQIPPAHELIAYEWGTPPYVKPGASGIINATVLNFGESNETDVTVQLLANGTIVDSTVIGFLAGGNFATVSLTWNPTVKGSYNVTLYVVPVPGETSLENNVLWKYIYVGFPVKAVVLHSAGNIYSDIITNWQVLNSEWHLFGSTMVYIDYTTLNKEDITYEDIAATKADVLIISCAYDRYSGWEFTDSEIEAIRQYVHEGHGLIATAGTLYSGVPNNNKLAPLFGLNEIATWTSTGTDLLHQVNKTHPIFTNVPDPLVFPQVGTALPNDGRWDSNELVGGKYLALGHYQESAIVVYRGLMYISPWLEVIPPYYHHHLQLLYNAITWSRYQKPQHELAVSLETLKYLEPGDSVLLNATVSNLGLNNETDVELTLLVDGAAVNSTIISELAVETSYTINYLWTPTVEKVYNVTAYVPPLPGEEFTFNNVATKMVRVMLPIKIAVLGDYESQLTNLLLENGIIAYERDWSITSDIYEYDAVIVNRPYDPGASTFLAFLEAADEYGVGLVFTSSWPGSSASYGISLLQWYLNDPEGQGNTYGQGSVYYEVVKEHPIFEGWNIGDRIYLITSGDRDHAWFWGYSGEIIGDIGDDSVGIRGGGIAYKIQPSGNKHLLLAGLAPQFYANTVYWTDEAKLILVRGVLWVASRPEHDLIVSLETPEYQMPNYTTVLNATVYNRGLNNETDVELFLFIEGETVNSVLISQLPVGTSYAMSYAWTPTIEEIYNVTAYASPVENETLIANNKATKFVTVSQPLIHPIEGQYANYAIYYVDPNTGEEVFEGLWNFTYLRYISPYQINVTIWMKDPYGNVSQSGWMIVNIFTRMVERDSGIYWTGMWYPGWIERNVTIGSTINLLWGSVTILDSEVVEVMGHYVDCWKIEEEYYGYMYTFWYGKVSGLWIRMNVSVPPSVEYLILVATNIPIGFLEHDLAVNVGAPACLELGDSALLNATVRNIGLNSEVDLELYLLINGTVVNSATIPGLLVGEFYTINYLWTPSKLGNYNITAYSPSVPGEEYTTNNIQTKRTGVWFYWRLYLPNEWVGGGFPMGWHGDDSSWSYTLPFDFPFYGKYYRTIYISSNGLITFIGPDTSYYNSIRTLAFKLAIAPAWDDWVTYAPCDIYIWQNSTHVSIRWEVVASYNSGVVANFEVTLGVNGRIQFNYGYNNGPISATIGISNGAGHILAEDISSLNNIRTIVFAGFPLKNDVAVASVVPSANEVLVGDTVNVSVVAENHGNATEDFNVTAYATSLNCTKIYLDPSNYIFNASDTDVGTLFNVTVRVEDVVDLDTYQVTVYFNDTIINVTRWYEPTWDPEYVFYGKLTLAPDYLYDHWGPGNGSVRVGCALFPPGQTTFNGNGKLCIIEFKITAVPPKGEKYSCWLDINNMDTFLLNSAGDEIPSVAKQNGYYEIIFGPLPPPHPPGVYEIGTATVTLAPGAKITLTFIWDTAGVTPEAYRIWAEASPVQGETDIADNKYVNGIIRVEQFPFVSFTYSPSFPKTGETITFSATGSTPDGGTIISYNWNFGDGNITDTTDPIITHTYAFRGLYNVSLTVTDSEGLTDSTWKTIYVFTRDVAIIDITPSASQTYVGRTITINVTVINEGEVAETFNVILYYNITASNIIGTKEVSDLLPGEKITLIFEWNTTGVNPRKYNITGVATSPIGETDVSDNTLSTLVHVRILGDINGDGAIDMKDVRAVAKCFASYPGHLRWNPDIDLNGDGHIDMKDIRLVAKNFGKGCFP